MLGASKVSWFGVSHISQWSVVVTIHHKRVFPPTEFAESVPDLTETECSEWLFSFSESVMMAHTTYCIETVHPSTDVNISLIKLQNSVEL